MKNKKNVWMKSVMGDLVRSVRLTLLFCIVLAVGYVLVLWLFARVAGPNGGRAEGSLSGESKYTTRIVGATLDKVGAGPMLSLCRLVNSISAEINPLPISAPIKLFAHWQQRFI